MESLGFKTTVSSHQLPSVCRETFVPIKEEVKNVWALFETDQLGNPRKKVASSGSCLFDKRAQPCKYLATSDSFEVSNQRRAVDDIKHSKCSSLPFHLMIRDWEVTDLIRNKWQLDVVNLETSYQKHWKLFNHVHAEREYKSGSMDGDNAQQHEGSNMLLYQKGKCAFIREDRHEKIGCQEVNSKDDNQEVDMVLPTYRLHVENPEGDEFSMGFAAPLILNRTLLEQKLNCCGKDLQTVSFLNLNHEGLSSLGESVLSQWCPKTRIFTADMNRLNSLSNAFVGFEKTLEQLSLKDNFLCDLKGLECLPKLQVVHLDGNYILQLIGCNMTSSYKNAEVETKNDAHSTGGNRKCKISLPISVSGSKCLPSLCWPSLREFGLSCNRISKVESLGMLCPNLEVLDLGSNNLVSLGWSQESALFGLRCLRVLDVGQNRLKGNSLWENLRCCPLLLSLVASRNQLHELPTHDGSVFLRELWLNGNSIRSFSCTAWLPNLQRLYLQDNEIDTVMPIWGFPALEVLDLSFNKISQVQQLQKLGCFSSLRSLQLNDNSVAELPNYTVTVLEAVPWLVELDNEPLTDIVRLQAVRNIFSKIMNTVGLDYVRSNILNGKLSWPNVAAISMQDNVSLGCVNNWSHEKNLIAINKVLAGDADLNVLWAVLLDVCHIYENNLNGSRHGCFAPFPTECEWRMRSFQFMRLAQKQRLLNSSRDSASLKEDGHDFLTNASEMILVYPGDEGMPLSEQHTGWGKSAKKSHIMELDLCLQEHILFNGISYEGILVMNEGYEQEVKLFCKNVTRLQAIIRGFLARRHQKKSQLWADDVYGTSFGQDFETGVHQAANKIEVIVKFQALWRGYKTRRRFQLAVENSKYEDFDDYEYDMVDDTDFLPENLDLKEFDLSSKYLQYKERFSIHELPNQLQHHFHDPTHAYPCGMQEGKASFYQGNEGELGKHIQTLVERKVAAVEIAKDWGFSQEKTALQLMRALENTRRRAKEAPKTNSETRYKAFISKCLKPNKDGLHTSCSLVTKRVDKVGSDKDASAAAVVIESSKPAISRSKGGPPPIQEKRLVAVSVTTLKLD